MIDKNMKKSFYYGLIILVCFLFYRSVMGQGTCASPDGPMFPIAAPPADYNELETGGYCNNGNNTTQWNTMCFTFTPTSSVVSLSAGYETNCNIVQFDLPNSFLYDNTCTSVGAGLEFSGLTPNTEYTWCLRMKANGGPGCNGFDRLCPYYIEGSALPVKLLYLSCDSGQVVWQTASEINNDFFTVYSSEELDEWVRRIDIDGAGTKSTSTSYMYYDSECMGDTYYKLEQTDYDGVTSFEGIVHCECNEYITDGYIIEEYNILGQVYDGGGIKVIKIRKGDRVVYKKIIKR
jgi:hypothetical protein